MFTTRKLHLPSYSETVAFYRALREAQKTGHLFRFEIHSQQRTNAELLGGEFWVQLYQSFCKLRVGCFELRIKLGPIHGLAGQVLDAISQLFPNRF